MITVVKFPSTIELGKQYFIDTPSGVANTETDAIVVYPLEADNTSVAEIGSNTQCTLYIDYASGSLTNATIRLYGSYLPIPGANDWYSETLEDDNTITGVATLVKYSIVLTNSFRGAWHFPIGAYRAFKITVASSGTITNSSIKLNLGMKIN